jgi:hypothetical protein
MLDLQTSNTARLAAKNQRLAEDRAGGQSPHRPSSDQPESPSDK